MFSIRCVIVSKVGKFSLISQWIRAQAGFVTLACFTSLKWLKFPIPGAEAVDEPAVYELSLKNPEETAWIMSYNVKNNPFMYCVKKYKKTSICLKKERTITVAPKTPLANSLICVTHLSTVYCIYSSTLTVVCLTCVMHTSPTRWLTSIAMLKK